MQVKKFNRALPKMLTPSSQLLFKLLCVSLGNRPAGEISTEGVCWKNLVDMAFEQGVAALAADGYNELDLNCIKSYDLRVEWFASVLQQEDRCRYKMNKAALFAKVLSEKGVKCLVLKGMAFASYYRIPEHRFSGDCDVYLGDGYVTGNKVALELGGRCRHGTHKHSHLYFKRLLIENHRYLTDYHDTEQGRKIEEIMKAAIGSDTSGCKKIEDTELICPSDHFNALYLLEHANGDFMNGGISLRLLYDWAVLLKNCQDSLPWDEIMRELKECRLLKFAEVMTSLCVRYLGTELTTDKVPVSDDIELVQKIMEDTMQGGICAKGKERIARKSLRITKRFWRFWRYRNLATDSVPIMIWNNIRHCSYLDQK